MSAREKLRAFVEQLPDDQVIGALRLLEAMRSGDQQDPMLAMLRDAPEDDEPLSEAQQADLQKALEEIERGDTVPWEEVREKLG